MKPNQFATLAVAAAASLVAALVAYSAIQQRSSATPAGAKLFPGLEADAGKIARIELQQADRTVTLEKKGETWAIKEKDGFLASTEKVRALLLSLTGAELAEAKTQNEQRYRILELEDPKDPNANSHLVRVSGADGKPMAEIVAGKKRFDAFGTGKSGSYVRRPNEAQTWLITREINAGVNIKDWARDRLFETRPEKIKKASIEVGTEAPYVIERDTDGRTFKLATMPPGKKIRFMNAADDIIDTASSFNIDDVRKVGTATGAGGGTIGKANIELDSGLKLAIAARRENDEFSWLTLSAEGDGEGKTAATDLKALATDWEFRIPSAQFDRIFKKLDTLVEDATP